MSLKKRLRSLFMQSDSIYARPVARRTVLGLAFFLLFMLVLSADIIPDKVSFEVGQVSERDILAPRTLSYVDEAKTRKLEAEVLATVANVYDLDVAVLSKAEQTVAAVVFTARATMADKSLVNAQERRARLEKDLPVVLSPPALTSLEQLNEVQLPSVEQHTLALLQKYLQRGIRDDELDITKKQIVIEAEELTIDNSVKMVVSELSRQLLEPNHIFNARETEKHKKSVLDSIEAVRQTIKKGQVVVRRGDVVTADQIQAMTELGLSKGQFGELRILGLTLFLLTVIGMLLGYLYKFAPHVFQSDLRLVLIGLILLVALLLGKAAHVYSDFVAPLATGALLAAILIDARVGLVVSMTLALLFGVIADFDLRAVAAAFIGSVVGVYSVSKMTHGYSLIRTSVWIAIVNFLVIGATGLMQQVEVTQVLLQGLQGIVSGIAAAIITTGLLPYLEHTFNITTPLKLLDLAQPNHPLMQRLLLEAPGTYHHSVLVGNLSEAAADRIGADPVTVRVGAYYHDIGKIKRSYFFVENQFGSENPHDKISPSLSTLIIISHIKDGVDLCREYNLPQVIIDIVKQHHGTMLVSYFYKRAMDNEFSDSLSEDDFRYEGPRPQTKEAALIMLADSCEAAVRSLAKPNINRIEVTVRKIIRERLNDGQLDECNLTLNDLNVIGNVYIRILSSMFHKRIEYPDALKELERRKNKNGNCHKQSAAKDDPDAGAGTNCDGSAKKGG